MNTKGYIFFFATLCAGRSFFLHASQVAMQQHEQKPTAEEIKLFLNLSFPTLDKDKLFELIRKYGKNIINEQNRDRNAILFNAAIDSYTWPVEEFEKLLQVPDINLNIESRPYSRVVLRTLMWGTIYDPMYLREDKLRAYPKIK